MTSEAFARAYARLRANSNLQFAFAPPRRELTPGWLAALRKALAELLAASWPYLKIAIWVALAIAVLGGAVLAVRAWRRRGRHAKPPSRKPEPATWRPTAAQARVLLADADRLAAEARYAEAVHLLLLRSVEDIQGRRPGLLRPHLTSRDIAALDGLPQAARSAFASLAEVVERSLFGGAAVDADAFAASRRAYEGFAFPQTWASTAAGSR